MKKDTEPRDQGGNEFLHHPEDLKSGNTVPLFIKTTAGLEPALATEMEKLNFAMIKESKRGVSFEGGLKDIYQANYKLRTALRVLMPIANFKAFDPDKLYKKVRRLPWDDLMRLDQTLAIDAATNSSVFTHSKYAALVVKDAIVDQFRDKYGKRPNVDIVNPDFRFNIHIDETDVTLSLDSSGDSLHKRGYRKHGGIAPLNEVIAAGIVLYSGWNKKDLFMDPMCGSGTIAIEAAMFAAGISPQKGRTRFGFESWPGFDRDLFEEIKSEKSPGNMPVILAKDRDVKQIQLSRQALSEAGLDDLVRIEKSNFLKEDPPAGSGIIVMNPPYGERIGPMNIEDFYGEIGSTLKNKYQGWEAWILSGNAKAMNQIGLRPSGKRTLFNAALQCSYRGYRMFKGSMKEYKTRGAK